MRTQTLTKQMYTASLDRDRDFHFRVKDPGSAATHFIGFLAAVLMTPVLLVHAAGNGADFMTMIGMSVFMISMILLYGASTSYHSFDISEKANLRLKRMDPVSYTHLQRHCTVWNVLSISLLRPPATAKRIHLPAVPVLRKWKWICR